MTKVYRKRFAIYMHGTGIRETLIHMTQSLGRARVSARNRRDDDGNSRYGNNETEIPVTLLLEFRAYDDAKFRGLYTRLGIAPTPCACVRQITDYGVKIKRQKSTGSRVYKVVITSAVAIYVRYAGLAIFREGENAARSDDGSF